jgi:TetR/AcrR family transcriptional regulator
MGGPDSSNRRDRILAAAGREFAAHGFSGARVDRIAALARVNKQLLFHYFHSKAGLYQAAIVAGLDQAQIRLPPHGQPGERLRQLVEELQRVSADSPALLPLRSDVQGAGDVTDAAACGADDWYARALGTARQVLEDGQRSGHFRDDLDPVPIAELVVSVSLGTAAPPRRSARADASDPRDRIRDTLVRLVMDYCAWR